MERHVREVAIRQRAKGLDVSVLTSDLLTEIPWQRLPPETVKARTTPDGLPIHRRRAQALADDLHYPFLPGLAFDLRRLRPDVVHVHTYGTYQGFSALALERLEGVPYILSAHYHPTWSIWGGEGRKSLRRIYDRFLAGPVLRHASRVVVQTQEEERLLREVAPDLTTTVRIPPGYTPLPAPSVSGGGFRGQMGIAGPYLLFVGRLASNKGLVTLVQAFARLAPSHPDLSLILVGEDGGSGVDVDRAAQDSGIASKVRRVGFIKDDGLLASAYAQAEVFILPSEYEAFGLVLLEAMAQGTPVVAARAGGMPDVVEEGRNGLLVPTKDAPALAAALEDLLAHPERRRELGRYGREVTVPRYSWDAVVDALGPVYAAAMARGRKA